MLILVNVNMLNVSYLFEIKIKTKNSAAPVGFEPETLCKKYSVVCMVSLT